MARRHNRRTCAALLGAKSCSLQALICQDAESCCTVNALVTGQAAELGGERSRCPVPLHPSRTLERWCDWTAGQNEKTSDISALSDRTSFQLGRTLRGL